MYILTVQYITGRVMKKYHQTVVRHLESLGYDGKNISTREGFRVWTRGDGTRYCDKDSVYVSGTPAKDLFEKIDSNAKYTISISDEFPSMPYRDAVIHKGVIFILCHEKVEIATVSMLKNCDVWKAVPRVRNFGI